MNVWKATNEHERDGFGGNDSREKPHIDYHLISSCDTYQWSVLLLLLHFSHLHALRDLLFKAVVRERLVG
jgi:hypothetical protein